MNTPAGHPTTRVGPWPLLGRDDVLARVDALLADCRAGHGSLLWIHGDAGIGKTRLLAEVAAGAAGCVVLRGTGWEDPGTPPFWVWSQVLRGLAEVRPPEQWGERGRLAAQLLVGSAEGPQDSPGRFPLFDAVAGVIDDVARDQPVVLLLDDAHWVDEGSLRLLQFLTSDLASRPVLVVCGWRDHDDVAGPRQHELAAQVAARGESWPLVGLGESDVRALLEQTTGQAPDDGETHIVHERTGGNPLFVSEMGRLATARGAGSVTSILPESALGTIRRRVARLAQPAQDALGAAAVLGASVSITRLGALLDIDPAELATVVDQLVDAGLVTQDADRLEFTHALVRDAVHDALPPAGRRELHRRAADARRCGPGPHGPHGAAGAGCRTRPPPAPGGPARPRRRSRRRRGGRLPCRGIDAGLRGVGAVVRPRARAGRPRVGPPPRPPPAGG